MIDIRQMRYFVAVAETLHFGRASERLHISQPPLSRQIAALEKNLGVRLLERRSRRATLTHAGRRFYEDCRAVLTTFDQACKNARLVEKGDVGGIAIGFMMHAAYTIIPSLTKRFIAKYPDVQIELREIVPAELADAVLSGRYDAAVMFDEGPIKGLETSVVHREPLCLAVYAQHALANEKMVAAKQLVRESFIAVPTGSSGMLRNAVISFCRSGGFEPKIALEAMMQQTIISLVAEGLGIALVPKSMHRLGVAGIVLLPLENAPFVEHVIAWSSGNLNPALSRFLLEASKSKL